MNADHRRYRQPVRICHVWATYRNNKMAKRFILNILPVWSMKRLVAQNMCSHLYNRKWHCGIIIDDVEAGAGRAAALSLRLFLCWLTRLTGATRKSPASHLPPFTSSHRCKGSDYRLGWHTIHTRPGYGYRSTFNSSTHFSVGRYVVVIARHIFQFAFFHSEFFLNFWIFSPAQFTCAFCLASNCCCWVVPIAGWAFRAKLKY